MGFQFYTVARIAKVLKGSQSCGVCRPAHVLAMYSAPDITDFRENDFLTVPKSVEEESEAF